ncbi:hypothetical protein C1646_772049 [Rhizophagus diaphanus]|nr:hypothetical protein C1646_772049 [Rhizophagus diaphanus] [Rhizophagus sp. MUCL 43196]
MPDCANNEFPMGYSWTTSNLDQINISYNSSLKFFPLSTKAEVMAILTALISCSPKAFISIHTNFQCAINTFHKLKNLYLISPRRFNKINNNILWSAIYHIIKFLGLRVKFIKVKAHSSNLYNDKADSLVKTGRLENPNTSILHDHLPNQALTIMWNNEISLDKDVRKCFGTILNYRRIENHFNHPSLSFIKEATKNNLIEWLFTSKWFNYNEYNNSTHVKHTKNTKWKIRCSTLLLPTMDIIKRNYPTLIMKEELQQHAQNSWREIRTKDKKIIQNIISELLKTPVQPSFSNFSNFSSKRTPATEHEPSSNIIPEPSNDTQFPQNAIA